MRKILKGEYPSSKYPREVKAFRRMQDRVYRGYSYTTWSRDRKGFNAFLKSVGKIPDDMSDPSLGRKKHSKGYDEPRNCKWQDRRENNGEPHSRPEVKEIQAERVKRLFLRPGIKLQYAKMLKKRLKGYWTKERREAASKKMLGNKFAAKYTGDVR